MSDIEKGAGEEAVARSLPVPEPTQLKYNAVGGWLLVLCFWLCVFSPIAMIRSLIEYTGEFERLTHSHTNSMIVGFKVGVLVDALIDLGLTSFGIYAGIALWWIRNGAVQTTKRVLLFQLVYRSVSGIILFLVTLSSDGRFLAVAGDTALGGLYLYGWYAYSDGGFLTVAGDTAFGVLYLYIWYKYLGVSKRVEATYPSRSGEVVASRDLG